MFDGIASGVLSLFGGERANRAQRKMASQQANFQERMSNTAYRRAMEDMKGAGLNPILAYQQGGASTPSGSIANQSDTVTPAVSTAMQYRRTKAEIENLHELNDKIRSDTILNQAMVDSAKADAALKANSALKTLTETQQLQLELPGLENAATIDRSIFGKGLSLINRISEGMGKATQPIRDLFSVKKTLSDLKDASSKRVDHSAEQKRHESSYKREMDAIRYKRR